MAPRLFLSGAQLRALRPVQSRFRILAHLGNLGTVALYEIALVFQEGARGLIVALAHNLLLLFGRGFLGGPNWLGGFGGFGRTLRFRGFGAFTSGFFRRCAFGFALLGLARRRGGGALYGLLRLRLLGFGFFSLGFFCLGHGSLRSMGGRAYACWRQRAGDLIHSDYTFSTR